MEKSFDHLKILTKQQIIDFLRQSCFSREPDERPVKWFLYEIKIAENLKKSDDHNNEKTGAFHAKKADELGALFNAETDRKKALKILKEREKHTDALMVYIKKGQQLYKEWGRIQKLIK